MDAVRSLASRGFTFDEADDVNEYASQYMQDVVRDPTAPPGIVSFAEGTIQQARGIPVHDPWPREVPFTYDDGLRRWLPNLTGLRAPTVQRGAGSTMENPPSVTGPGGPSQQPHSQVTPAEDVDMSSTAATEPPQLPPPAVSNPQSTAIVDVEMDKSADGTTGPPAAP